MLPLVLPLAAGGVTTALSVGALVAVFEGGNDVSVAAVGRLVSVLLTPVTGPVIPDGVVCVLLTPVVGPVKPPGVVVPVFEYGSLTVGVVTPPVPVFE